MAAPSRIHAALQFCSVNKVTNIRKNFLPIKYCRPPRHCNCHRGTAGCCDDTALWLRKRNLQLQPTNSRQKVGCSSKFRAFSQLFVFYVAFFLNIRSVSQIICNYFPKKLDILRIFHLSANFVLYPLFRHASAVRTDTCSLRVSPVSSTYTSFNVRS